MDRRNFLSAGLKVGLGVAAGLTVGSKVAVASRSENLPYPYVKLNPEKVAKRAYHYYHKGHCAYSVFASILDELKEKVGRPYTYIPSELYVYGKGGIVGWGTVCGTLNGACGIISLTCKDYGKVIDALFDWYTKTKLPTFVPPGKAAYPTSVSNSPLCHVSVMKWCKAATNHFGRYIAYNSKERSERCARLSASVAYKTVELINAYHDGTFVPVKIKGFQKTKMDCRECHSFSKF
ncbi:MAG: C-GCAxxG-C-C family protein [Desulfurobacteriaceae bacterium]